MMSRSYMGKALLRWLVLLVVVISAVPVHAQDGLPADQQPLAAPTAVGQHSPSLLGARPGDVFPVSYVRRRSAANLNYFPLGFTLGPGLSATTQAATVVCNGSQSSYCLLLWRPCALSTTGAAVNGQRGHGAFRGVDAYRRYLQVSRPACHLYQWATADSSWSMPLGGGVGQAAKAHRWASAPTWSTTSSRTTSPA